MKILKIVLFIILFLSISTIIVFTHKDIPLNKLKTKYTNSYSSFVNVSGINVHYRDEGIFTDSIPIVLIHGTGSSLHAYDIWSKNLKKNKRIIRMDLPAFGLTGPFLNNDYSISNYITFLKEFLDNLNIRQCILVGNSLGGEIAWRFAVQEPVIARKLILIDAGGYPVISNSIPIAFKLVKIPILNKILTYITPRFIIRSSIENVYFDKSRVSDSLVSRYFDLTLRKGNREAIIKRLEVSTSLTNSIKTYNSVRKIKQPTLIIWGSNDQLIPVKNAYKFKNDITNSKLIVLQRTGHVPMEEKPLESLKHVIDFLKN